MNEIDMHKFTMFFKRLPGEWWLTGDTLIHWITHHEVKFFDTPGIAVSCSPETYKSYCSSRGGGVALKIDFRNIDEDVVATENEKEQLARSPGLTDGGLWRKNIVPELPYCVQLPFRYGSYLDKLKPLWWRGNKHGDYPNKTNEWFTRDRKVSANELLSLMLVCGERAGIRDAMWLGFGGLLGYVMLGDWIWHDNDVDLCIKSEKSTPSGDKRYIEEIQKPFGINGKHYPHGLCEKMWRFSNDRDGKRTPVWISIGHKSIVSDNGVKSCNWWTFDHSNYTWHSKGDRWVTPGKFQSGQVVSGDKAMCLGQPSWMLEEFIETDFHGIKVNMPKLTGSCLDWWYPGWDVYGKGSSAKKMIMAIPNWIDRSTWRIL